MPTMIEKIPDHAFTCWEGVPRGRLRWLGLVRAEVRTFTLIQLGTNLLSGGVLF
jgi:hypothetical protein